MKIIVRKLKHHPVYLCIVVTHDGTTLEVIARPRDLRTFMNFRCRVADRCDWILQPFVKHAEWRALVGDVAM